MIIRFFFYLLLIYLIYRLIRSLFGSFLKQKNRSQSNVYGTSEEEHRKMSDIDQAEIEDATFEEIDEDAH